MKILLVNDDGVRSLRLSIAKRHLEEFGEVWTVAPSEEQSAKSMAITTGEFTFKKQRERFYTVDGTPADCVTFALFGLKLKPDLVVSGINYGYNLGADIMYSGTVGAAFQACYHGYPSVAVSGFPNGNKHIENHFKEVMKYLIDTNVIRNNYVININFPNDKTDYKGHKFTRVINYDVNLEGSIDGNTFKYSQNLSRDLEGIHDYTDIWMVNKGYVSMSRIGLARERAEVSW